MSKYQYVFVLCLLLCTGSVGSPAHGHADPFMDLDRDGEITTTDLLILISRWHNTPGPTETLTPTGPSPSPTATPTITPSPSSTPTRSFSPTPTLTPTISYDGRLFGNVSASGTAVTVNLRLEPEADLPPYNTISLGGQYEFTGLPIGFQATLSTVAALGYQPFSAVVLLEESTRYDINLVGNTATPTRTETPSITATSTASGTPTDTPTPTITPTASITETPTQTATPTITPTPSITNTETSTATDTATPTRTATPSRTLSRTPSPTETRPGPTPTAHPLTGTWYGQAVLSGLTYEIAMTRLPGSSLATVSLRGRSFVNEPQVAGSTFLFPQTSQLGTGAEIMLTGVLVSGSFIQGSSPGDIQFRISSGSDWEQGTFALALQ